MNSIEILSTRLSARLLSKSAASFFINGGPGTGKSYLVENLVSHLPSAIPGTIGIGPDVVTSKNINELPTRQMRACLEAGFLESMPPKGQLQDVADAWSWFGRQGFFSPNQVFAIFVDLAPTIDIETVASLFSRARHLEAVWRGSGACLLFLIVGSWDTIALAEYYDRNGISFPYTQGQNYVVWEGISLEAMNALLQQEIPNAMPIHGQLLYEITSGNPAVALEILEALNDHRLSMRRLLDAAYQAAAEGEIGKRWLNHWTQLSAQAQQTVGTLLRQRYVADLSGAGFASQLLTLGIVKRKRLNGRSYLQFSSWYMELLFRFHLEAIDLQGSDLAKVQIPEMVPPILSVNKQAYEIIHEIENAVRDFIVLWLSMHSDGHPHILTGKVPEYVAAINDTTDLYERAAHWRHVSENAGLPKAINPLIAYCSLRDLASLVDEIGYDSHSNAWQHIARLLRKLAYIRDAVMHNQLIDDEQFLELTKLQEAVYDALAHT